MGREDGRYNQQNTRSHAAPSRGRRVLSIAVNPEDYSQLQCGGITVTQHSNSTAAAAAAAAAEHRRQSRGDPQAIKPALLLALHFK